MQRLQSAIEYLTTYGWAILMMGIVLSVFVYLGVFNVGTFVNSQCLLQADFSCLSSSLPINGTLMVNIQQNTPHTITIDAMGCNADATYAEMHSFSVSLPIGSNSTFSMQCYNGTTQWNGSVGQIFSGYLIINYTDSQTGFSQSIIGTLIEKVS